MTVPVLMGVNMLYGSDELRTTLPRSVLVMHSTLATAGSARTELSLSLTEVIKIASRDLAALESLHRMLAIVLSSTGGREVGPAVLSDVYHNRLRLVCDQRLAACGTATI